MQKLIALGKYILGQRSKIHFLEQPFFQFILAGICHFVVQGYGLMQ